MLIITVDALRWDVFVQKFAPSLSAFALQWGMGEVINLWPATADGGYAGPGYRAAFAAALVLQAIALAWLVAGGRLNRKAP